MCSAKQQKLEPKKSHATQFYLYDILERAKLLTTKHTSKVAGGGG
jgi:hypothetical protein